jgi:hypothetical protein
MKDIFSTNFTFPHSKKVIFDIVKDDKNEQESYCDKILGDKIIGLEIDEWLKNHGCKAIFNRIEKE